jgi:hypothetical protein
MNPAALKSYLYSIEQALRAGNATEHTHRPALKTLAALAETIRLQAAIDHAITQWPIQ